MLVVAAALHAGWNALVRRDPDPDTAAMAIAAGGAILAVFLLPFLPGMAWAAAPFTIASSFLQILYFVLVGRAYRAGELSIVYPVMRGLAPAIVTGLAALTIAEPATGGVVAGVGLVAIGMATLGASAIGSGGEHVRASLVAAVLNAAVIASYTLVDGIGARLSGAPTTYTAWLGIGAGIGTLTWRLLRGGRIAIGTVSRRLPIGLVGAVMSFGAYAIALWAMTRAPIGAVATVRESSVLFATALGALVLHEKFGPWRWLASALVVAGLALVKLGGTA
jgi:drug/metabolite transporter (DMT)-like permease